MNEKKGIGLEDIKRIEASVRKTDDFTDPEELHKVLVDMIRRYHPSDNLTMIESAYKLAAEAHKDQKRKSGEPYIIHPLSVAIALADLEMDKETITAGILHDVVEDTVMTHEDLIAQFGEEVANLVDGVTKLGQLAYQADKLEVQAENLRKMFLAMAKDIRVIIIKLADRLHNMRTLKYMRPEKQKEIARETMDIYAPIAQRLGISKIKVELDDLSLKYLQPEVYYDLAEKIALRKNEREKFVQGIIDVVKKNMEEAEIDAKIDGRVKHFFSIYKKMVNQNKTIDQVYDLFAIRIIVETVRDCYAALGVIHEMYTPIPGRFKDYIAMPKPNMYRSLHTTLIGPNGTPFEIQIRTFEMHRTAEYGIAAHWKYKELSNGGKVTGNQEEAKLTWLRQILEWQRDTDNKEFMNLLKNDLNLFAENVYCFTPAGDVKNLPSGSTPIDFAYSVHSAVGNKMVGARVNGKLVNIDYVLQNGDRVDIITSQNSKGPSRDWLKIVKSTQARNKINQWFKQELKEDNINRGKDLIASYSKAKSIVLSDLMKQDYMNAVMIKYGFRDWESVLAAVGRGALKEGQVVNRLVEENKKYQQKNVTDKDVLDKIEQIAITHDKKDKPKKNKSGIIVKGIDDMSVRFAKCCGPVPGDEIVGYVTRGRGVTIHRTDCMNIINLTDEDRPRLQEAEWKTAAAEAVGRYPAQINIFGNNRTGLMVDISRVFSDNMIDIIGINSRTSKQGTATLSFDFEVESRDQLDRLIGKLRQVESVLDIVRTTG